MGAYFEPMATTLVLVDASAKCTVFFLNLWNAEKGGKVKTNVEMSRKFNLDISMIDHTQTATLDKTANLVVESKEQV